MKAGSFAKLIFYGNYFYGICVVATMLETARLLAIPFNDLLVYVGAFAATVVFYNYPYARNYSSTSNNPRSQWHFRNKGLVYRSQVLLTIVLLIVAGWLVAKNISAIESMSAMHWFLVLIFPVTGAAYYGGNVLSGQYNLRQVGWLKPFVIGFVWAGMVTVYPVLYHDIIYSREFSVSLLGTLLFVKNCMFVAVLAMMFDIKDYAADSKHRLKTLVVALGLRKTIFYVLLPLPLLGVFTFLSYAISHEFRIWKMVLIMIPFLLLLPAAHSLRKRRTLMYYLVVIDGLLLLKALIDILATYV